MCFGNVVGYCSGLLYITHFSCQELTLPDAPFLYSSEFKSAQMRVHKDREQGESGLLGSKGRVAREGETQRQRWPRLVPAPHCPHLRILHSSFCPPTGTPSSPPDASLQAYQGNCHREPQLPRATSPAPLPHPPPMGGLQSPDLLQSSEEALTHQP